MDLTYITLLKLVAPQLSYSEGKGPFYFYRVRIEVGLTVSEIVDTSHTSRTEHDPRLILAPFFIQ